MGLGLKVHVGHVLGLEHDLGLGVDLSYKPCWDHIIRPIFSIHSGIFVNMWIYGDVTTSWSRF